MGICCYRKTRLIKYRRSCEITIRKFSNSEYSYKTHVLTYNLSNLILDCIKGGSKGGAAYAVLSIFLDPVKAWISPILAGILQVNYSIEEDLIFAILGFLWILLVILWVIIGSLLGMVFPLFTKLPGESGAAKGLILGVVIWIIWITYTMIIRPEQITMGNFLMNSFNMLSRTLILCPLIGYCVYQEPSFRNQYIVRSPTVGGKIGKIIFGVILFFLLGFILLSVIVGVIHSNGNVIDATHPTVNYSWLWIVSIIGLAGFVVIITLAVKH